MQRTKRVDILRDNHLYFGFFFILAVFMLSACGKTNINNVDSSLSCNPTHVFSADYNRTWKAVVVAVSSRNGIRILDRRSGLISSKVAVVEGQELSMLDTAFFGKTYKYSYEIVVSQGAAGKTNVTTNVKLILNQFWFIMNREQNVESIESYLRKKLFESICDNLFPAQSSNCKMSIQCTHKKSRSAYDTDPGIWESGSSSNYSGVKSTNTTATVKSVQIVLSEKGYKPGPADGLMGRKTKNALKLFQRDNHLPVTGRIDQETKDLLLSSNLTATHK